MKFFKEIRQPKTIRQTIEEEIYQAQLDRLNAKASAEHWLAMANMMDERVRRLETFLLTVK